MFVHTEHSIIYVSPNGRGDGSTELSASDLQWVLTHENVIPGDTIVLLDGTYTGNYQSTITGTLGEEIIIKPKNFYMSIIDGSLQIGDLSGINGAFTIVRNLRIYNSNEDRGEWTDPQGSNVRPTSLWLAAPNCTGINNIIHDGGVGIGAWQQSDNATVYGNLVFNSGWADEVLGGAQNMYWQSGNKTIKHNIFCGAFKATFAGYSEANTVTEAVIEENVFFVRNYVLVGTKNQITDEISVLENHAINGNVHVGYLYNPNGSVIFNDNRIYAPDTVYLENMENIQMSGNKLVATGGGSTDEGFTVTPSSGDNNYIINSNEYHYTGGSVKPFEYDNFKNFTEWQALGYDAGGSYSTELPSVNEIFVYPNEYTDVDDKRMGIVVIWNWAGDNTVAVDLTDLGLQVGTTYRWRQAQDPLVDVDTWECAGNTYTFAMTGHTVAKPIGFDEELVPTQFPTFGCFIIEKV